MLDLAVLPEWLSSLLTEKFYNACIIHEYDKKNEKNVFCLDCCEGICPHCLVDHPSHRLLQIRRYVYHDVIRVADGNKLMDCAQVQCYTTNGAKVVFLNQRPMSRPPPPRSSSGSLCLTCDRKLHESSLFCSISCKLEHLLKTGCKLSEYLRSCDVLVLSESGSDDGLMTPDSVLEPAGSLLTESGSGSYAAAEFIDCATLACTATTEVVRKKRSNLTVPRSAFRPECRPVSEITGSLMNRRKGTPQRSPLY